MDVLFRELGPVDAIRFIQLFYGGKGDYTEERHNWLKYQTVDEVMEDLQKRRETLQQEQESSP
ncbi:MAG: hypothetical protein KY468_06940 [Armatimonadetes bacterium]|nr:hypothetical protein [Armatimonadota bacterium]